MGKLSTMSSARENLKSLFTHALREPRDTPHKDARRNSIDSSEVEDSPQIDRIIQERSRDKGKRMSFSESATRSWKVRLSLLLYTTLILTSKTPAMAPHNNINNSGSNSDPTMGQGSEGRLGGSGGGGVLQWRAWGPGNNSN